MPATRRSARAAAAAANEAAGNESSSGANADTDGANQHPSSAVASTAAAASGRASRRSGARSSLAGGFGARAGAGGQGSGGGGGGGARAHAELPDGLPDHALPPGLEAAMMASAAQLDHLNTDDEEDEIMGVHDVDPDGDSPSSDEADFDEAMERAEIRAAERTRHTRTRNASEIAPNRPTATATATATSTAAAHRVPNATSRALAARQNMGVVDASSLGPPTGLRNDDGAPTYYPPLPTGSGGGNGAGPGILAGGFGGMGGMGMGGLGGGMAMGGILVPARAGIAPAPPPPPPPPPPQPVGFAGYPGALGVAPGAGGAAARMVERYGRLAGGTRATGAPAGAGAGTAAGMAAGMATADATAGAQGAGAGSARRTAAGEATSVERTRTAPAIDPTVLLGACARRFGSNFYPDPLMPYCGRRLGRNVVPSRDGTCSPRVSSRSRTTTCSSCARLHDSLRLARLRYMFGGAADIVEASDESRDVAAGVVAANTAHTGNADDANSGPVVSDPALIAALRCNSGLFAPTVKFLAAKLKVDPRPHPREVAYIARVLGLPERLARIALRRNNCDSTLTLGWVCGFAPSIGNAESPMEICYREALAEEQNEAQSRAGTKQKTRVEGKQPDELQRSLLCSLCPTVDQSTNSSSRATAAASSKRPARKAKRKARDMAKSTSEEDDKMEIDTSGSSSSSSSANADGPVLLNGHCLVPAKHYADIDQDTGGREKPLTHDQAVVLQAILDAKLHDPKNVDVVLMRGLASIITDSKENELGKEIGESLAFDLQTFSAVTQQKLYRFVLENSNSRCPLCTLPVPSPYSGRRHCVQCQMCEGCIRFARPASLTSFSVDAPLPSRPKMVARKAAPRQGDNAAAAPSKNNEHSPSKNNGHSPSKSSANDTKKEEATNKRIVHVCPAQPNGSHLHHHPLFLQLTRSKTAHCDIEGPCCTASSRTMRWQVSWSCSICDFDICHVCIGNEAPTRAPARSIPNSRSVALPSGTGTGDTSQGHFDRRLGLFICPQAPSKKTAKKGSKKLARKAKTEATKNGSTSTSNAAKSTAPASTSASTSEADSDASRRKPSAKSSTAVGDSSATASKAAGASTSASSASARAPSNPATVPRRSPSTTRSSSAPAAPTTGSRPAAARATNSSRVASAPTTAVARRRTDTDDAGADFGVPGILGLEGEAALQGVLADPVTYFDRIFERLGARAAALGDMVNLRNLAGIELPPGLDGGPGGGGVGIAIARIGGARARAGRAAGAAGARATRRSLEKSLKKKDEKLVSQIWNVEPPPPGPGKDSGVVVVNTGSVTPNTATDLGSGLLSPASMTDYGRIWLYAFRSNPGTTGGGAVSVASTGEVSRSSSLAVMTEDAKAALSSFMRSASRSGSNDGRSLDRHTPCALDITTAELYCQRIQSLVPQRAAAIRTKAYGMIAMGKLGLVGTILSAASFAPLALSGTSCSESDVSSSTPATSATVASSSTSDPMSASASRSRKRKRESSPEKRRQKTKPNPAHEAAQTTTSVCFCGSPIDLKTAPDGCVGCLRCGHAIHAPCAADLLLGGGVCPACRNPLYQPRLCSTEIDAADQIFQKELLDMDKPEEANSNDSNDEEEKKSEKIDSGKSEENVSITIKEGDFVRISTDKDLCATIQSTCPTAGGWSPDMAECCGVEGQVIAIVSLGDESAKDKEIAYRVRMKTNRPCPAIDPASKKKTKKSRAHSFRYTRRCRTVEGGRGNKDGHSSITTACIECHSASDEQRMCVNCETCITCLSRSRQKAECCDVDVHQWIWSPALVTFVKKGILPRVYTERNTRSGQAKKTDVAAATEEAQKHMMRLRAELHAVKASRDRVRADAESIFGSPPDNKPAALTNGGNLEEIERTSSENEDEGATQAARMMVGVVRDTAKLKLPESIDALKSAMSKKGSVFQFHLASHLLTLAEQWVSNPSFGPSVLPSASVMAEVKMVHKFVADRNLEAAARHIRNYNTTDEVEQSRWECAYDTTGSYVVKAGAQLNLLAYPKEGAPRTGFILEPKIGFRATNEHIDSNGNTWAQVVVPSDWPDSYLASLDEKSQDSYGAVLVGCRVKRGPNWRYGNQDGGEGNEGVVVKARKGLVLVKWNGIESKFRYRYQPKKAGQDESSSSCKKEVEICSAIAPPQGWFQVNSFPQEVERVCTTLQCWACSKSLCASTASRVVYKRVRPASLRKGDMVLIAATLQPVTVEEVTDHQIHCSFPVPEDSEESISDTEEKPAAKRTRREKTVKEADHAPTSKTKSTTDDALRWASAPIWYRPVDLVMPAEEEKATVPSEYSSEVRMVAGKLRTMHEVALLHPGDKESAKSAWDAAGDAFDDPHGDITSFASCIRGHLLHPKCFQTALLSGQRCPAPGCGELLWLPSIVRDEEHVTCGEGGASAASSDTESMRAETDVSSHGEEAKTDKDGNNGTNEFFTEEELAAEGCRMCPACCSGPFLNQHCSDMRTHHGQCGAMAWRSSRDGRRQTPCLPNGMTYQVSATEISKRLMQLSKGKTVADVLPRCPTHKVSVMFNGCRACGHLFTDLGWHNLPKWDPNAKEKVALDKKKMQASILLCSQIRKEAAQLEFERSALEALRGLNGSTTNAGD